MELIIASTFWCRTERTDADIRFDLQHSGHHRVWRRGTLIIVGMTLECIGYWEILIEPVSRETGW